MIAGTGSLKSPCACASLIITRAHFFLRVRYKSYAMRLLLIIRISDRLNLEEKQKIRTFVHGINRRSLTYFLQ